MEIIEQNTEKHIVERIPIILSGWYRHVNKTWGSDTPLMQRYRKMDNPANLYYKTVVTEAENIGNQGRDEEFGMALSIVEMITYEPLD